MKKITFLFAVLVALATGIKAQDVGVHEFRDPSTNTKIETSFNIGTSGTPEITVVIPNWGPAVIQPGATITFRESINGNWGPNWTYTYTSEVPINAGVILTYPLFDITGIAPQSFLYCLQIVETSLGPDPDPADNELCITLVIGPTSVEEKSLAQFSAFPNPANNMINVVSPVAFETVRLFDMAGREVYSFNANEMNHQINVSNLPVGLYFLSIEAEGNKSTKKVSIVR